MARNTALIWVIAIVITLASAVYQRMTGPTYELKGSVQLAGETISYELLVRVGNRVPRKVV